MTTHTNPSFDQTAFRGVNDDGSLTTATFKSASNNTNWSQGSSVFRVRCRIQQTDAAANQNLARTFMAMFQLNGAGGYSPVGDKGSATAVRYADNANGIADNASISAARLGAGAGSFVAGSFDDNGATATVTFASGAQSYTEVEFCVELNPALLSGVTSIQIRVYETGSVALAAYTQTPSITYDMPSTVEIGAVRLIAQHETVISTSASGAGTVPATVGSGAAASIADASGSPVSPAASASGSAGVDAAASGAPEVSPAAGSGAAQALVETSGAGTAPQVEGSGAASSDRTASGAATTPAAVAAGSAQPQAAASGSLITPPVTGSGSAAVAAAADVTASGAGIIAPVVASGQFDTPQQPGEARRGSAKLRSARAGVVHMQIYRGAQLIVDWTHLGQPWSDGTLWTDGTGWLDEPPPLRRPWSDGTLWTDGTGWLDD